MAHDSFQSQFSWMDGWTNNPDDKNKCRFITFIFAVDNYKYY